jgi:RNA recognition motif-containing protein
MGKKLYVGNLSFDVSGDDLQELFAQAGICESTAVITDRATGRSRGFAFVEMQSAADAKTAIEQFNGKEYKGRQMTVNEARERESRGSSDRGGRGWNRSY